ncbi:MAG: membrane protein insertion efficiency factor YidD [Alphaproteobacteria bacterium]|nr:membrane protein insertion efficiency factor YidD [Alphaproteobacteria bacterium]
MIDKKTDSGNGIVSLFLRFLIFIYRHTISVFMGRHCRFEPSCSVYADQAIKKYGAVKGCVMAFKRVCRCNPWGGGGFDPP